MRIVIVLHNSGLEVTVTLSLTWYLDHNLMEVKKKWRENLPPKDVSQIKALLLGIILVQMLPKWYHFIP